MRLGDCAGTRVEVGCFAAPAELPERYLALLGEAEAESFDSGALWYENYIRTVPGGDPGVRLYAADPAGASPVLLPLRVAAGPLGQRIESLANYYTALYSPLPAGRESLSGLKAIVEALTRDCRPAVAMRFSPMDPQAPAYRGLMAALKEAGWAPFPFFCFGNWYLPVRESWDSYLEKRDGTLRSTLKRMGKAFAAAGGRLELVAGGAALEEGIRAYEQVYAASWKPAEPYPQFVAGLARSCAGRGWLRLGIARLGATPVAAQIWIVAHGKASIYKLAYHQAYMKYSPGTLLTAFLMRHAFEADGVAEVDYLIGDDPYKRSWMSHRRERWGIVAYNPRTVPGALLLAREVLGRAARKVSFRLAGLPSRHCRQRGEGG